MNRPKELFYICHVDNLDSILHHGIYSRAKVGQIAPDHIDIHAPGGLGHRDKALPNGKNLHGYVNLYFQPRNAMLYLLICNEGHKKFVILSIDSAILDAAGVWVTDRNAAVTHAEFLPSADGVKRLDGKIFSREYWTESDDTKQKMMAEALVPDKIDTSKIKGIYISSEKSLAEIQARTAKTVAAQPHTFFAPQYQRRLTSNISLSRGDMFFSSMQTFTISVNVVGVMGKGLASRTKYQFPDAYVRYQDDCKSRKLKIGKPTLFKRAICIETELADDASQLKATSINGARWFLFFPTKRHWQQDSKLEDIEQSLQWLVKNHARAGIESIALPALGCGLGNLHWREVGPLMCRYLQQMEIRSCIYLPMQSDIPEEYLTPSYLLESG